MIACNCHLVSLFPIQSSFPSAVRDFKTYLKNVGWLLTSLCVRIDELEVSNNTDGKDFFGYFYLRKEPLSCRGSEETEIQMLLVLHHNVPSG